MARAAKKEAPSVGPSVVPFVRHWHERERVVTPVFGESLTHQSFADESDINRIVRRYYDDGVLPTAPSKPVFADVTTLQVDLTDAINNSKATVEKATQGLAAANKKRKAEKAEQAKKDAEDLARFRQQQKDLDLASGAPPS